MKYLLFLLAFLIAVPATAQEYITIEKAELPRPPIKFKFLEEPRSQRSYRLEALPVYEVHQNEPLGLSRGQWAYLALHVADLKQTMNIVNNPDKYVEKNKILGPHPTREAVTAYWIVSGALWILLTEALQGDTKDVFVKSSVLGKGKVVVDNDRIGL